MRSTFGKTSLALAVSVFKCSAFRYMFQTYIYLTSVGLNLNKTISFPAYNHFSLVTRMLSKLISVTVFLFYFNI